MGYVAEIHLSHEALLLQPTITSVDEPVLRRESGTQANGADVEFVSVIGGAPDGFDTVLERDGTIRAAERVVDFSDRSVYRVTAATELVPVPPVFSDIGGYVLDAESAGSGWSVDAHLPDRTAISKLREYFRSRDVAFHVGRLYDAETIDRFDHAGLTEKQRDLLLTALYSGYYEVPRRASQGDLADQLDVSTSAISKQIRRAVGQLIVSSLAPEEENSGS